MIIIISVRSQIVHKIRTLVANLLLVAHHLLVELIVAVQHDLVFGDERTELAL